MPNIPRNLTRTNVSINVLNAIREDASPNYKLKVPYVAGNADNLRDIGAILFDNPALLNEFEAALVNRFAFAVVRNKYYANPLSFMKKGKIEVGETIEDIFVAMAEPYNYDGNANGDAIFRKYESDVKSAFYVMNFMAMYPATINRALLKSAFTSISALDTYIQAIITSLYTAMNYDEQQIMMYLLAYNVYKGRLNIKSITGEITTKEGSENMLVALREMATDMTFSSSDFTIAGVNTHADPLDVYILVPSSVRANTDVRALAAAYNRSDAEALNTVITIPKFSKMDLARLRKLMGTNPSYHEFTATELAELDKLVFVMHRDFMQCYDNLLEMRDSENPVALYYNHFLHHWGTYAVCPFVNAGVIGNYSYNVAENVQMYIGNGLLNKPSYSIYIMPDKVIYPIVYNLVPQSDAPIRNVIFTDASYDVSNFNGRLTENGNLIIYRYEPNSAYTFPVSFTYIDEKNIKKEVNKNISVRTAATVSNVAGSNKL